MGIRRKMLKCFHIDRASLQLAAINWQSRDLAGTAVVEEQIFTFWSTVLNLRLSSN